MDSAVGPQKRTVVIYSQDLALLSRLKTSLEGEGYALGTCDSLEMIRQCRFGAGPADCVVLGSWHFSATHHAPLAEAIASCFSVLFVGGNGDAHEALTTVKSARARFVPHAASDEDIRVSVRSALADDSRRRSDAASLRTAKARLALLTGRESQVCSLVARGLINKHIAAELGISEKTVKYYRARLRGKLQVASVAELVRLVDRAAELDPG